MGAIAFPFTQLLFPELPGQITMAAAFGGFALLVQFLVDFENRLEKVERQLIKSVAEMRSVVEEGFSKVNNATRLLAQVEIAGLSTVAVTELMHHAGQISPHTPPLISTLAQAEIDRVSRFLRGLAEQEANYDGEDRDWLLELTRNASRSIDAISLPEVDAVGNSVHSFWRSPLGQRYLDLQRKAVGRNVRVRRIFVTQFDDNDDDLVLQHICRTQRAVGIEVRLLLPRVFHESLSDFIVFDNTLSYEAIPDAHVKDSKTPTIVNTRLKMRTDLVAERIDRFRNIWDSAVPWVDPKERDTVSIPYSRESGKQLLEEGRP